MKYIILILALILAISGCSGNKEKMPEYSDILITPQPEQIYDENVFEETKEQNEKIEPTGEQSAPEVSEQELEPEPENEETETLLEYDELILVNPTHFIPDDYEPELETVQGKYKLDKKAASAAKELLSGAKEAGFDMQLCSAYRTVEKSAELYSRKVNQYIAAGYDEQTAKTEAAKWVAPPGTSEHHTGLAMDLVSSDYWGYYSDLEHDYEKFDSFKWMYKHCAEYGFILRYPEDKQDITGITYEPWHYRYVGKEAAAYIMENGICLEEYLDEIG